MTTKNENGLTPGAAVAQAILNDPKVVAFTNVLLDKMSAPMSRVLVETEPIKLTGDESRAIIAQDRCSYLMWLLERAGRLQDEELAKTLRIRIAEVSKLL